eukprot:CAMPEP_0175858250 /NCGR_PEP_ID=MMETSP0107_2-20121207/29555_1 /TAXON_ID=195067 ORGANISM="Goniomonas pacifica, Strain CCMP1869" /NCGR_SAMPLE_ID=MMETSP0107_2 /ASSEMBLY_ACC=CAM_ASM_000203 /LENGTH=399 /DNA_ID=CAMNT_0017174657 /DNA_START=11 /DNA_END=1208 /DNA_ORIENTATION=-
MARASSVEHKCALPRVKDMTKAEFHRKFRDKRPFIVSGRDALHLLPSEWSTTKLVEKFGSELIDVGDPYTLATLGFATETITFEEYILSRSSQQYVFQRQGISEGGENLAERMGALDHLPHWLRQFLLSEQLAQEFHSINMAKRGFISSQDRRAGRFFLLIRSQCTIRSTDSHKHWLGRHLGRASEPEMLQCIQQPGELIYLPEDWWHATHNLGNAMAVGGQLSGVRNMATISGFLWRMSGAATPRLALEAAEKGSQAWPTSAVLHNALGNVLLNQATRAARNGNSKRAKNIERKGLAELQRACNLNPLNPIYAKVPVVNSLKLLSRNYNKRWRREAVRKKQGTFGIELCACGGKVTSSGSQRNQLEEPQRTSTHLQRPSLATNSPHAWPLSNLDVSPG